MARELADLGPERTAALLAEWSEPESPDLTSPEVPALSSLNAPPVPGSDPHECEIIAENLLRGAGYRGISWGHPEVHLTAARPPVTPVTWALWFAIFGHRFDVVRLADALYGTLTLLLLFFIGRRISNERVGLMATAALAAWPQAILLTAGLMTETLFVMLELLFVWLCLRAGDRPTLARFAAAGLCAGLATLTRPNLLPLLPLLPFWSALVFRRDWRALAKSLAVPAVAAATIAPWAYRNFVVFHELIPVSTQSGINFLFGNNGLALKHPDMMGYLIDKEGTDFEGRARGLNEAERDKLAAQLARAWLWENRDQWGLLVWTKLKKFWSPVLHQPDRLVLGHAAELGTRAPPGAAGARRDVLELRQGPECRHYCTFYHYVRYRRIPDRLRGPALSIPDRALLHRPGQHDRRLAGYPRGVESPAT